jgi:trigger factor
VPSKETLVVQSSIEDLSPVVKKVSVELPTDRVRDALDLAYQGLSRTVKLKGYRAGHVPRRLVEKYFGDDVRKDVAQKLVAGSIHEALGEHKLSPVAPPRVENGEVDAAQPFKYVATVEVRPHVDPKDYEGLSGPKVTVEVTDQKIDDQLEELRHEQSMFVPIEGREVVEAGDFVATDYEGFLANGRAPLKGAKREGVLLEAVPGSLLDNKAEGLIGAKLGETREVGVTFPANYTVAELRGQQAVFVATARGLKKRETPALDDQFVQDLGGTFKTLDELKAGIRKNLEEQQRQRGENAQREALLTALVEKNPLEAPPALVERNVDAMLQNMLEGFQRRGMDPQQLGLDLERMRDDLRTRAVLEVKGFLLLEAIAEKEKLEVSQTDVDQHMEKLAGEVQQPVEKIRQAFKRNDSLEALRGRLRQDKALAFLLAKANLT